MTNILDAVNRFVWGAPALVMILGIGLLISIRTGFVQIRLFPKACREFFSLLRRRSAQKEGISSFQALCTALGATVGTGNLVGVAGAICIGGPGSIFWMWVCAFVGMATKYAEATLAVRYRSHENGIFSGGPMQIIAWGLKNPGLAKSYALFGLLAAYGVGNATQINAVITGMNAVTGLESFRGNLFVGILLALLTGLLLLGGAKRIGAAAERLVPVASAAYILLCAGVLMIRHNRILSALFAIVQGAFSPGAVTGGIIGSALTALRTGCARGVFTNEAGMGTASIAHASADVDHPAKQGLMGIMEVFLDTIVICTLTALVILVSGVSIPYGVDGGGALTTQAFSHVYGDWTAAFLAGALCCFAFATVLGWGLYGARCAQFLFGTSAWNVFALLQTIAVVPGAVLKTETVWLAAEIINGLMAIPNLIALAVLAPVFLRLVIEYKRKLGIPDANGGYYADFHQCKPL